MNKRAFSFIEVFVTLVIATFFLAVVYMMWNRGIFFINRGSHYLDMQRGARFTMEYLHDDLDMIAHFKTGKAISYNMRSGNNELEFYRYSDEDEKPGRPGLMKVLYTIEDGRLTRSAFTEKGKLITKKSFGNDFTDAIFEPYFLKIGPLSSSMSRRYFLRAEFKGEFEVPQVHAKQEFHVVGSFSLKTPNGHFRDLFFCHNPVSVRESP